MGVGSANLDLDSGYLLHGLPETRFVPCKAGAPAPYRSEHFLPSACKQQGHLAAAIVSWLEDMPLQTLPGGYNLGIFSQATHYHQWQHQSLAWRPHLMWCLPHPKAPPEHTLLPPQALFINAPIPPTPKKSKNHLQGDLGDR